MKRSLSISTSFNYDIPIEQQLPLIANAGFTHITIGQKVEHSYYNDAYRRNNIKRLLSEYSLAVDTIHGPRLDQPDSIEMVTAACQAANDLEAPVIVLHASSFAFGEKELDDRYTKLIDTCIELEKISEKYNVKFALENVMPGIATDLIKKAILTLDSQYIGFCYDSSHDQIGGPNSFESLESLKEHLLAVHISDRVKEFVDHVIPWEGFIEWDNLSVIIRNTKYNSPLLLEIMVMNSQIKETKEFLNLAYDRGCKLYDMIYR